MQGAINQKNQKNTKTGLLKRRKYYICSHEKIMAR
jgi:hypothetical protein